MTLEFPDPYDTGFVDIRRTEDVGRVPREVLAAGLLDRRIPAEQDDNPPPRM